MNIKLLLENFDNQTEKLQDLLNLVAKQQNEFTIQKVAQILAKHNSEFDHFQQSAILEFILSLKENQNDEIQIKLISTLLHLINKFWMKNSFKLFNLFFEFSFSNNTIIQSSAIQGLLLIIENLEKEILFEGLEIFFLIYQDKTQTKINSSLNPLLCKDIFLLLLKKQFIKRNFEQFLEEKLLPFAKQIDICSQSNVLQQINSINLIFSLITINEEYLELCQSIICVYENQQLLSIVKVAIHDGLTLMFSSEKIVLKMIQTQHVIGKESYYQYILEMILQHSIFPLQEYEVIPIVKQSGLLQNFSAKYLDYLNQSIENKYIQQISQLIIILVEKTLISELFKDEQQKLLLRPILKLLKKILDISNLQQHYELLKHVEKWIKSSYIQLDLAIKLISDQSNPKEKEQLMEVEESKQKWYKSFQYMFQLVSNYINDFSATSWNLIVTLFQQVENLHLFEEEITKFFISTSDFDEATLLKLIDGLSQQILKISEKIQIQTNQMVDCYNLKKLFALDKIILIIQSNYFRLEILWGQIEALFLCLCSSKSIDIRSYALNSLKSVVCSCFHNGLLTNEIFNPINELINSRYDDVVEYVMNLLFFLIKQEKIQDKFYIGLIKIFETLLNEKEEFIHLVLCLNCLNELIFNQLEHLNDQCLMRLSSLLVYLTKYLQKQYHMEIKNKIICMIWQLQLQSILHKLNNPSLWNLSLKLIKHALENQGELKFAAIHITSQFCLISQNEQFQEIFELFEELISLAIQQYQRVEFQQIALFNNTPRFNNFNVIETPKFQIVSLKFDRQTVMEQFKQSLEILKLCIQLWTEVIIQKNTYDKFFYFFQSFNQAQLVYIKHELVISLSKILNHSKSQLNIALDFIYSIFDNEAIDVQYFIDNDTFSFVCQILQMGFEGQNFSKCFFVSAKLLTLVCTDNFLSDNLILKYFISLCVPQTILNEDLAMLWLDFIVEQFSLVGVQLRYHKLLEMLCNAFDVIIKQIISNKIIEQIQRFVKQLIIQLNKSQRFINDNSEKLQLILSNKIKDLLPQMLPQSSPDLVRIILEQIFMQNKRMTEWIKYFLTLNFNEEQQQCVIDLLTQLYLNWITTKESIPQQTSIINIISLLENQILINQVVSQQIKPTLLYSIYKIIDSFIEVEEQNNEEVYNVGLMVDFIIKQEKILHPSILKLIKCPQLDIRLKIIGFLKQFQPF